MAPSGFSLEWNLVLFDSFQLERTSISQNQQTAEHHLDHLNPSSISIVISIRISMQAEILSGRSHSLVLAQSRSHSQARIFAIPIFLADAEKLCRMKRVRVHNFFRNLLKAAYRFGCLLLLPPRLESHNIEHGARAHICRIARPHRAPHSDSKVKISLDFYGFSSLSVRV